MEDHAPFDHDPLRDVETGDRKRPSPEEATRELMTEANAPRTHLDDTIAGDADKLLHDVLPDLTNDELARISVLQPGTPLEQGAVYVDLLDSSRAPFKALGGTVAGPDARLIAKRETDTDLWNRLVAADRDAETEPSIFRPARQAHGIANETNLTD
jgi:hypothetical protein